MCSIPQPIADILQLARWAPSGDNTQPWRFEVIDERHLVVHAFDTRDHCVYDLDGHPSQIAHGALLETLAIAASAHGLQAIFKRKPESEDTHPDYSVELFSDEQLLPDPLLPYIEHRFVQRRAMRTTPLTELQKQALQDAVGKDYTVRWFTSGGQRWRLAKLMFDNAKIRLTLPEAYTVHRDIIEWGTRFSEDKVPDQALGLDAVTLKLMQWVMVSWKRVHFFNTFLAGHLIPRLEMDLIPGIFCAAHFAILSHKAPETIDDYVAAGRATQRFWLTATSLGLGLQPELTPLLFSRYVREKRRFSQSAAAWSQAQMLAEQLNQILANDAPRTLFLGRIGLGALFGARSLRLPLSRLTVPD
ncbi:Nitroreductase family protein [Nitrosomonas cryotolerans]|uniref:Nitroreductase family protein n=1 Tax=Nitrosomonas cryotolerans ATCC 49181 TaxID=1131553 RepID=A0A1N6HQN8_9PROT|nr:nitroreductase family protein [Nitrosomonas cryotolerans]SFQ04973.1 Nitroreductase family protein [Nitrosomonas cryotolerans]SIO22071.1 Nitroreductase family protein [Nitrosomonas cryotolerans ATCC 49181]